MKIRSIVILAGIAAASTVPQARAAGVATALPMMGAAHSGGHGGMRPMPMRGHRWGGQHQGRWVGGWRAPGGWGAYRRPVYGYVLPRYWISPGFYIANYATYGLPRPAYGYGWSRYYDDAVMTDAYGRVYDTRSGIAWDRDGDGYDDRYERRRDDGLGGAAIGAVVGGVAGNVIAGKGNRTAGTVIGAVAGAVAGAAIDRAEDAPPRRHGAPYDRYADDSVTYRGGADRPGAPYDYEGRWSGTWRDENGREVKGEYEGRFEGSVSGGPGVDYDAPYPGAGGPSAGGPHWMGHGPAPVAGGYVANGWYYPAPIVTTVTVTPQVTTTTVTEEVIYKRPVVRRKVRRTCKCK